LRKIVKNFVFPAQKISSFLGLQTLMYAEVVTFVAGSLEAGGLPGYPEVLLSLK
jgi:hypothetical protein